MTAGRHPAPPAPGWSAPAAASAAGWTSPSGDTWFTPTPVVGGLARDLALTWTARMSGEYRLVPDGCVEVLWLGSGAVWVCGPETSAWTTRLPRAVDAVGIRFRPGRAGSVLGLDAAEVRDRRVALDDVLGSRRARYLVDEIGDTPPRARASVLSRHAGDWVRGSPGADPAAMTVREMVAAGASGLGELAEATGLSERQVRRRCRTAFGYGPAMLRRVLRLQRFLELARSAGSGPPTTGRGPTAGGLAALAAAAGYTDQPHLSRDCREIAGVSPADLVGRRVRSVHDGAAGAGPHWAA